MIDCHLLFSGSRTYSNGDLVGKYFNSIKNHSRILSVIVGDARGLDTIVKNISLKNSITPTVYPAKWNQYGKSAGIIRSTDMMIDLQNKEYSTNTIKLVTVFFEGESIKDISPGTKYVYDRTKNDTVNMIVFNSRGIIQKKIYVHPYINIKEFVSQIETDIES